MLTSSKFAVNLGRRMRMRRVEKDLTQLQLAKLTQLSTKTILDLENAHCGCNSYTLYMIAQALDTSVSDLIGDQPSRQLEMTKALDEVIAFANKYKEMHNV